MKKIQHLRKKLNINFLDFTNKTIKCGLYDIPALVCKTVPTIDYLATYSQPSTYFMTQNTCVSFFEYDVSFDGINGLWNGIYYSNKKILDFFKTRFAGVKYFVSPDYSKLGDSLEGENIHRQIKSRVTSLWLSMELGAIVIPLIAPANYNEIDYCLDGLDKCQTVAFNTKGPMRNPSQRKVLVETIRQTVNNLHNLKSMLIYTSMPDSTKIRDTFSYATDSGIQLQIPNNMLRTRNYVKGGGKYDFV